MIAHYSPTKLEPKQLVDYRASRHVKVTYQIIREVEPTVYEVREVKVTRVRVIDKKTGKEI